MHGVHQCKDIGLFQGSIKFGTSFEKNVEKNYTLIYVFYSKNLIKNCSKKTQQDIKTKKTCIEC